MLGIFECSRLSVCLPACFATVPPFLLQFFPSGSPFLPRTDRSPASCPQTCFIPPLCADFLPAALLACSDCSPASCPQIYFRQEKYDMAAVHFKSAASINPASSVLHCYIAMTLHRQGLHDRALTKLQVRRCVGISWPKLWTGMWSYRFRHMLDIWERSMAVCWCWWG